MEHVVFYPAATGVPAFRRVGSLDEAVNFVEHLRNVEGISDFSVHELAPVQLSFRAYYHAHVPATAAGDASEPAAVAAPVVEAAPVFEVSQRSVEESALVLDAVAEPAIEASPVYAVPDAPFASADGSSDEVSTVPIQADDDRSAEWIAAAAVVESPVAEAPAAEPPAVPGLAAEEPIVAIVPPFADPVAENEVVAEAPVQRTPFADAPPVTAPAGEADPSTADEPGLEQATADVVPALAPSGRRSLGFFAR